REVVLDLRVGLAREARAVVQVGDDRLVLSGGAVEQLRALLVGLQVPLAQPPAPPSIEPESRLIGVPTIGGGGWGARGRWLSGGSPPPSSATRTPPRPASRVAESLSSGTAGAASTARRSASSAATRRGPSTRWRSRSGGSGSARGG